ncbi:MAG: sigma-70 family RNA polymerase sigma factor [Clostridiaceae bacterium]|nr:sigma-70 family RNA polymerase sigma factor [Clostridiaceae bacterium]
MANLFDRLRKAQNHDDESIQFIVVKFEPLLKKYANRLPDLEDAKSELTLKLLNVINKIPLDKDIFKKDSYIISYINISIKNCYYSLYLENQKNHNLKNKFILNYDLTVHEHYNLLFYDLIKNLSKKEKYIFKMKYINNYSNSEIASTLNVSRQNVQICIKRALEKLKKNINGDDYNGK